FALDRQIVVERKESLEDRIARPVAMERGILTAEIDHVRRLRFAITNRSEAKTTVYLRHTVTPGWTLHAYAGPLDRLGDAHLFTVDVDAGQTRTVDVQESTPIQR